MAPTCLPGYNLPLLLVGGPQIVDQENKLWQFQRSAQRAQSHETNIAGRGGDRLECALTEPASDDWGQLEGGSWKTPESGLRLELEDNLLWKP
jgi:hypothetical protein